MTLNHSFKEEINNCLKKIKVSKGQNVYAVGNLSLLGKIRLKKNKKLFLFLEAFQERISEKGTIFSAGASMNLMNTKTIYDPNNTPTFQMGAFSEYLRNTPNVVRSFHPFWSVLGLGPEAKKLKLVSRHAFGVGSPWSILLDLNTLQVNFGIHPSKAVTLIHHIETIFGVPYRYTKEFKHPIKNRNGSKEELFYQLVMYKNCSIKKKIALNEHFFIDLEKEGKLHNSRHSSGLQFWSFKMTDFYDIALRYFISNIYNYLEEPPAKRPYQK